MAKPNLKRMSVAELVALGNEIQSVLAEKIEQEKAGLQKRIDALAILQGARTSPDGDGRRATRRKLTARTAKARKPASKKRRKVAPKYRGPDGDTWTGRGNTPRWLAALEAQGKKRESYLIKR